MDDIRDAFIHWYVGGSANERDDLEALPMRYVERSCPVKVRKFIKASLGVRACQLDERGISYPDAMLGALCDYLLEERCGRIAKKSQDQIDVLLGNKAAGANGPHGTVPWQLCHPDSIPVMEEVKDPTPRVSLLQACADAPVKHLPVASSMHVQAIEQLTDRYPNFAPAIDAILIAVRLQVVMGSALSLPPLLLQGPPGVGKTAFALALAEALPLDMSMQSFAQTTASFLLTGISSTWSGGQPGAVAELCIRTAPGKAPLMFIDELDKVSFGSYRPDAALYSLLEERTAERFRDENLKIEIDVRPLSWIFTSNRLDTVNPAILSRLDIVEIDPPTAAQMPTVVRSVDAALRRSLPKLSDVFAPLSDETIDALSCQTPRQLTKLLKRLYGNFGARTGDQQLQIAPDQVRQLSADRALQAIKRVGESQLDGASQDDPPRRLLH